MGSQPANADDLRGDDAAVDRRSLFRFGAVAAAGAAAAAVSSAIGSSPADATTGTMTYGGYNNSGSEFTTLTSASSIYTLVLDNSASGNALFAHKFQGAGDVIEAQNQTGGNVINANDGNFGTGSALWAHLDNTSNTSDAVFASTAGSGSAIHGLSTGNGYGVYAKTSGTKGALGANGGSLARGGVFASPIAQVRLAPSAGTTHPASGLAGDLFVDKSARLWFCKGGATWVQMA